MRGRRPQKHERFSPTRQGRATSSCLRHDLRVVVATATFGHPGFCRPTASWTADGELRKLLNGSINNAVANHQRKSRPSTSDVQVLPWTTETTVTLRRVTHETQLPSNPLGLPATATDCDCDGDGDGDGRDPNVPTDPGFEAAATPSRMAPKGVSTAINPVRLQSVSRLKLRNPDKQEANPCVGPMTAMLSCWASSQNGSGSGCAHLEKALRECMDQKKQQGTGKSNFNYHLSRLYPQIRSPERRKGSLG